MMLTSKQGIQCLSLTSRPETCRTCFAQFIISLVPTGFGQQWRPWMKRCQERDGWKFCSRTPALLGFVLLSFRHQFTSYKQHRALIARMPRRQSIDQLAGHFPLPRMVRPPGLQSEWFAALYAENCVQVLNLLTDDPFLLTIGRSEDKRRVVEGPQSRRSFWKGRTALHVGARRGSVDLVKAVLAMFEDGFKRLEFPGSVTSPTRPTIFLEDLLAAKDGWYSLDALAMAVLHGNRDIIRLLAKASLLKCESNPYEICNEWEMQAELPALGSGSASLGLATEQLRRITEEVMESLEELRGNDAESLKAMYAGSQDFNFLPWQEFLFHFTFLRWPRQRFPFLDEVRKSIFGRTESSPTLRRFLCELQDGQGRTALHVAVDEGTVLQFLVLIPHESPDLLSALDGTGKMALHRAAAKETPDALRPLLGDERIDLQALYTPWYYSEVLWTMLGVDHERVSKNNRFKGYGWFDTYDHSNALHIAIIHKRKDCVELLLNEKYNSYRPEDLKLKPDVAFARAIQLRNGEYRRFALEPLQLAAVVEDASIIEILLKNEKINDPGRPSNWPSATSSTDLNPLPALHLVAASGRFELLNLFMQSKNYDIMVEDLDQNTTLHHATKGREFQFSTTLIDHVICEHASDAVVDEEGSVRREDVERQGCIELLLQAGFDIWKTNKAYQAPYPGPDASAELLAWWYKRFAKETVAQQSTLTAAANAITVTATLVATASFQGPLQPPLGWNSITQQMQITGKPMKVFIVCDTLSFYLAVAAIMSALIPSLPVPQESMVDELRRTRTMMTIAVGFLFPSIISILIAFAAASIAVIPDDQGSWNAGGLTIATSSFGGLICVGVICLFFVRVLRLAFYRNVTIRSVFKATTF